MTVNYLADMTLGTNVNNNTTISNSFAGGYGARLAGIVLVSYINVSSPASALAATYGGTAMTHLGTVGTNGSSTQGITLFGLLNAPTGTQTVNVTCSDGSCVKGASVFSYENVASFGTTQTWSGTGTGNPVTQSVNTAPGRRVFYGFAGSQSGSLSSFSQSQRENYVIGPSVVTYNAIAAGDAASTSASTSFAVTRSSTGIDWGSIGVDMREAVPFFAMF